jgi:hypothetical protein
MQARKPPSWWHGPALLAALSVFAAACSDDPATTPPPVTLSPEPPAHIQLYAGIHYRFDVEAGQGIGRQAAALALAGSLE